MPANPKTPTYIGGEDPAVVEKRRAYDEALDRLSKSLEARQQRTFDPALLGVAMEFLNPGKTGSFWEAAGRAAGAYSGGQEKMFKEEQDIAQQQLQTAQMGMELERQRQQDLRVREYLGGMGPTTAAPGAPVLGGPGAGPLSLPAAPSAGPAAAAVGSAAGPLSAPVAGAGPSIGLATGPAAPAAAGAAPGAGQMPPAGVAISPGLKRLTGKDYIRMMMGTAPLPELLKEAARIDAENVKTTEGGVVDLATGRYYAKPTGKMVERMVYFPGGAAKTMSMNEDQAQALDEAVRNNDPNAYRAVLRTIERGPFAGMTSPAPTTVQPSAGRMPSGAPDLTLPPPPRATGVAAPLPAPGAPAAAPMSMETAEPALSVAESAARAKAGEELEVGRVKSALKTEENLPAQYAASQRAFQASANAQQLAKKYSSAFGLLQDAGLLNGVLGLVSQGIQTPMGSISIPGVEDFVLKMSSDQGLTKQQIAVRQMAARDLAEIELAHRRQYFAGYGGGAISDMEQKIVSKLGADLSDRPEVIIAKMQGIKMRAQHDMDEYRKWLEYSDANPKKTYNDFIKTKDFLRRQDQFAEKLGKQFGIEPAIPSEQKAPARAGAYTPEQVQAARNRLRGLGAQ